MRIQSILCTGAMLGLVFIQTTGAATAQDYIAGAAPNQRPEGAPVIRFFSKDAHWYEQALKGVSQPYPRTLSFLDNQGAWFNPFQHPGMVGPYDIRGHHSDK